MNRREVQMLTFPQHGDERGHLVVVEGEQDIPFVVKRIFYMYGSDRDVVRGQHANRRSEFVLINVSGQAACLPTPLRAQRAVRGQGALPLARAMRPVAEWRSLLCSWREFAPDPRAVAPVVPRW